MHGLATYCPVVMLYRGWDLAECGWDLTECRWDLAECGWDLADCGWDLSEWLLVRASDCQCRSLKKYFIQPNKSHLRWCACCSTQIWSFGQRSFPNLATSLGAEGMRGWKERGPLLLLMRCWGSVTFWCGSGSVPLTNGSGSDSFLQWL